LSKGRPALRHSRHLGSRRNLGPPPQVESVAGRGRPEQHTHIAPEDDGTTPMGRRAAARVGTCIRVLDVDVSRGSDPCPGSALVGLDSQPTVPFLEARARLRRVSRTASTSSQSNAMSPQYLDSTATCDGEVATSLFSRYGVIQRHFAATSGNCMRGHLSHAREIESISRTSALVSTRVTRICPNSIRRCSSGARASNERLACALLEQHCMSRPYGTERVTRNR
jgi:hypothetical protein